MHRHWLRQHGWALLALCVCSVAWGVLRYGLHAPFFAPHASESAGEPAAPMGGQLWVHVVAQRAACAAGDAGGCAGGEQARAARREPLAGVHLSLLRATAEPSAARAEADTAADGSAQLRAPAGNYWLLASAPGHARWSGQLRIDESRNVLEVELAPELPLRVRVLDDAERPLAGATVLLSRGDPFVERRETSALGSVNFEHAGERVDSLRIEATGFAAVTLQPASRDVTVRLSAPARLEVSVVDSDGAPASGAAVWLSGLDFWPPRQLAAAADGALVWNGLGHGSYELRATLGSQVGTASITLDRGERGQVTLRLVPGRELAIRLVDAEAAERLVTGADVVLVEDGLGPFPLRGQTGADGRLSLGPIPFTPFTLSARASGFMPESAVPIAADVREVQVALLRAGRVRGQVRDPDGAPIEGASLEVVGNDLHGRPIARRALVDPLELSAAFAPPPLLIPLGELGVMPLPGMPENGPEKAAWVSDRNGNFRLDEVPPGSIRVLARHPRFVESASAEVGLTPGGEAWVQLVLPRGAALSGRLLDASGRAVSGARIEVRARHGTEQSGAFTRDDGSFAFSNLACESDVLVARPSDRQHFVLRRTLELGSGETRRIDLTLPAERAPLELSVTGPDQRPIAAAQASILSLDPDSPARQSASTDASGRARFGDAAGRALAVRVAAPGFAAFEAQLDGAPARLEVSLERSVKVTGRVTQVRGRQPLEGARVVLMQRGERRSTGTDARGQFQFSEAAPGAAELSISHRGFATRDERYSISATGLAERAFELPPVDLAEGGAVEGRVLDTAGDPVRGARVGSGLVPAFVPAGAEPRELSRSDAAGHFLLEGVAVGKTVLSAYAAGLGRGSVAGVEVRAGETSGPVEIRLSGAAAPSDGGSPANLAVTLGERAGSDESEGNEVVIVDVAAGSEAERAGVRTGDVLIAVDGVDVNDMAEARRRLGGNSASDVIIDVERDEELLSLNVRREAVRR